jgi:predicted RecB family nuclease
LGAVSQDQCVQKTLEAARNRVPVIYQGELSCDTILGSSHVRIAGRPDFLILDGEAYLIRDSKLSRKVDDKHHVEIAMQLQLYGWLFEQTVGKRAKRLQVHAGGGNIIEVPYDGGTAALTKLAHILKLKCLGAEPYEPLGWSKCSSGCGYYDRCWQQAEERQDVSLVMDVDQGLARALNGIGVSSAQQLLANFDARGLSELKRPSGKGEQRVGKKAEKILMYADEELRYITLNRPVRQHGS